MKGCFFNISRPFRGDSPRGGEMPAGQRGPLSTRGTSEAGGGVLMWNLLLNVLCYTEESLSQPAAASALFKGAYVQISLP